MAGQVQRPPRGRGTVVCWGLVLAALSCCAYGVTGATVGAAINAGTIHGAQQDLENAIARHLLGAQAPAVRAPFAAFSSPPQFLPASRQYNATIYLDASPSKVASTNQESALKEAPPGKSLVFYSWTITQKATPGGSPFGSVPARIMVTVPGPKKNTATVYLPSGFYDVSLVVKDSSGVSSTPASNTLTVGARGNKAGGPTAAISLPFNFVDGAPAKDGKVSVPFSAWGSAASPGRSIKAYVWAVLGIPKLNMVANAKEASGTFRLPPGQYQVGLLTLDSAGDQAIVTKALTVR